jgi:hypothetical protein
MLDNVVEVNGLPSANSATKSLARRHGLGFLGLVRPSR